MLAHTSPVVLYAVSAIAGGAMLYLAFHTSYTLVAVLLTCLLMMLFAVHLAQWVMKKDEGTADMQEVRRGQTRRTASCGEPWTGDLDVFNSVLATLLASMYPLMSKRRTI